MDKIKLSDFFKEYKPKYIIGTTFSLSLTFFESIVYPFINKENLHQCLVLCDELGYRQATSELSAVRGVGSDYLLSVAPISSAFHSKIWIFVEEERIGILLGSGNLTQSGFINSVELFDFVEISNNSIGNKTISEDLLSFLNGVARLWDNYDSANMYTQKVVLNVIKEIEKISIKFSNEDSSVRILSNFNESIGSKLPKAESLYISSPFFGGTVNGVALLKEQLESKKVFLYPGIHPDNTVDIPIEKLSELSGVTVKKLELQEKQGFHHLKVFGGVSPDSSWFFTSSSNCTEAALFGSNVEVGLLRQGYFDENYFQGVDFPEGVNLRKEDSYSDSSETKWIQFECDNSGTGLSLAVSKKCQKYLPIRNAVLVIKNVHSRTEVECKNVFENLKSETISWNKIGNDKIKDGSCHIIIKGMSDDNQLVEGIAIVNNINIINLSPQERRAYRSVLSFISGEELPDLGDLSAIFGLMENIESVENSNSKNTSEDGADKNESHENIKALWPPQVATSVASTGSSGEMGAFHLCQKALTALISDTISSKSHILKTDNVDDDGNSIEVDKKTLKKASSLCEQSQLAFERVLDQYNKLEPSKRNAGLVWGKIIYVTLVHILISKKALSLQNVESISKLDDVIMSFTRLMFSWRVNDNLRGGNFERYKGRTFPPLYKDLNSEFGISIDTELSKIIVLFFSYVFFKRRKDAKVFPLVEFLNFLESSEYKKTDNEVELENIFNRYLYSHVDAVKWEDVRNSYYRMLDLGWDDLPGLKSFKQMIMANPNSEIYFSIPGQTFCIARGCRDAYMSKPEFRDLKEYQAVICSSCNSIISPIIFKEKING